MQGPPWSGLAERRRILTDDPETVNSTRTASGAVLAVLLTLAGPAGATIAERPRPPHELHVLVVLAGFPDRPLAGRRPHFTRVVERFVAYWSEVSSV